MRTKNTFSGQEIMETKTLAVLERQAKCLHTSIVRVLTYWVCVNCNAEFIPKKANLRTKKHGS